MREKAVCVSRSVMFLIAAKTSLKLVQRKLDEVRGVMVSRPYYSSKMACIITQA